MTPLQEHPIHIGALHAKSWSGLILCPGPGEGFGFRFAAELTCNLLANSVRVSFMFGSFAFGRVESLFAQLDEPCRSA